MARLTRRLLRQIDPLELGFSTVAIRRQNAERVGGRDRLRRSIFSYFSFFLMVAALLLAALFFRLGVEQRAREMGLLRANGSATGCRPSDFSSSKAASSRRRQRSSASRRRWLGRADDLRAADVVARCRGHERAVAARRRRSARRRRGGAACLRGRSASCWRCAERTRTLTSADPGSSDGSSGGRGRGTRRRSRSAAGGALMAALGVVDAVRGTDAHRRFFGAGSAVARRGPLPRSQAMAGARAQCAPGDGYAGARPARDAQRDRAAGSKVWRSRSRRRRGHPDLRRRISQARELVGRHRQRRISRSSATGVADRPRSDRRRAADEALGLEPVARSRVAACSCPLRVLPGDDAGCLNLYKPTSTDRGRRHRRSSTPAGSRFGRRGVERRGAHQPVACYSAQPTETARCPPSSMRSR